MIKGIYGINIAVKDLDEATKKYEKLFGVKAIALGPGDFAFPGLTGAKLDVNGTFVNLISYSDENSSVAKFLNSKGEGRVSAFGRGRQCRFLCRGTQGQRFSVYFQENAEGRFRRGQFRASKVSAWSSTRDLSALSVNVVSIGRDLP